MSDNIKEFKKINKLAKDKANQRGKKEQAQLDKNIKQQKLI